MYTKQIDSVLLCVCSVIDHRRPQNVVIFLLLLHFDVISDLLLNRRTATWNLFVKQTIIDVSTAVSLTSGVIHFKTIVKLKIENYVKKR